jgi:hypothetical protein
MNLSFDHKDTMSCQTSKIYPRKRGEEDCSAVTWGSVARLSATSVHSVIVLRMCASNREAVKDDALGEKDVIGGARGGKVLTVL